MSINMGQAVGYLDLDTTGFKKGFTNAKNIMSDFFSQATTFSGRINMLSKGLASVGSTLTKTITVPAVGLGTTIVKVGMDFEKAMSQVQATMGANKEDMGELADIAKKMGAQTQFSATQAAEALNYLALAGYNTEQQVAALPKVLNLASAGDMDLAAASDMLTDSMSALGLASRDSSVLMSNMSIMVDQMSKAASKSNTSVAQLGEAILTVGGTAKSLKGGTTELNTVLGVLADNGIKASEGGTHLRNVILAMNPTTDKAAAAFKALNLQAYDTNGELRSLDDIFLDLGKSLEGMSDEKKTQFLTAIFNKTDLSAVNALLSTSAERWKELGSAIEDSGGAADKMASDQLDNLQGQLTILKSGLEGVALSFNDVFVKYVKIAVEKVQQFVDKLNSLDESQKELIVKIVAVAAALGPVMLIMSKVMSGAVALGSTVGKAFDLVTLGASRLKEGLALAKAGYTALAAEAVPVIKVLSAVTPIMAAIAAIAALVVAWRTNFGNIRDYTAEIIESIKGIISGLVNLFNNIVANIKSAWESNFLGIQDIVTGVIENIEILFEALLNLISTIFDGINKLVNGDFKGAMDAFAKLPAIAWEAIKKVFTNLFNFVGNILVNLAKAAKGKMTEFATYLKEGAINAANNFINFLKELPYKFGVLVGKVIAHAVKFAMELPGKAKQAGKEFFDNIINFLKNLPDKTWTWLSKTITKAKNFAKDFGKKAKEAAKEFGDSLLKKLKELPGDVVDIGIDIAKGIGKGIKKGIDSAIGAVKDFGKGIMDGFKGVFDIHSPSKKAEKEIGEQVANGVINGIKNKKDAAKKTAKELAEDILNAATKKLDALQTYNKISLQQEVVYWDTIRKQLKKGTEERLEADKKYYETKQNYQQQVKDLDKQYIENQTAIYKQLNDNIESLTNEYNNAVESRTNAILGTFKLFDEYTKRTETTGQTLLDNLQSQVNALKDWELELLKLEGRNILPPDLVEEIRNMGVDASGEIAALNTLTDEELQKYAELWQEKNKLAREWAIRELKPLKEETSEKIKEMEKQAKKDLKNLTKTYNDELKKLGAEGKKTATSAGNSIMLGLQVGIGSKKSLIQDELNEVLRIVNEKMKAINAAVNAAKSAASELSNIGVGVGIGLGANLAFGIGKYHSNGLDYVPHDNYAAYLHKGERVLTKEENESYNKNERTGGDVFNFYGTPPLDERETARQFKKVQKELALGF